MGVGGSFIEPPAPGLRNRPDVAGRRRYVL